MGGYSITGSFDTPEGEKMPGSEIVLIAEPGQTAPRRIELPASCSNCRRYCRPFANPREADQPDLKRLIYQAKLRECHMSAASKRRLFDTVWPAITPIG